MSGETGDNSPDRSARPAPRDHPTTRPSDHQTNRLTTTTRFALQTLQREAGSSPEAARPTLARLAGHAALAPQRETLLALAERAARIERWAKGEALEKLLLSLGDEKILLFTHFRATQDRLAERFATLGLDFVAYHGSLTAAQKDAAIRRFESEARILLSTEAAGEGRNLQFCRVMVNFDLPWNPLRIEQRIGRIHRIGQTRPVSIYNLSAAGTVEDYLLDILERKVNMFELVIGEMDMILGELAEERDFEDLLFQAWAGAHDEAGARSAMEQLGDSLAAARARYQQTREYDETLFGQDFTAD